MTIPDRVAVIPLSQSVGTRGYALVDAADVDYLNQWRWTLNANGYAWRTVSGSTQHVYMHREIAGATRGDGLYVDHMNRDRLDNRRANLRIVTPHDSAQNKPAITGRYRGVHWDAARGKWAAAAQLNGRRHHIGRYDSEEAAGQAAADWRRERMPFSEEAAS